MPKTPLLSILIPSFNSKSGLQRVLEPLLRSDLIVSSSIEVIISDDSYQPLLSRLEVEQYESQITRFRYLHNAEPLGAAQNWNHLVSLCQGEFYWICHHDEYFADMHLALHTLLRHIRRNKADVFIFPLLKSYRFGPIFLLQCHTPFPCILRRLLAHPAIIIYANPIGPPSSLILKSSIPIAYDVNLKWFVDVEYYTRLFIPDNRSLSILPHSCRLISDQDFEQSITRSLAPTLFRAKVLEVEYLAKSCNFVNPRDLPFTVLLIKAFLFALRTIRTRFVISM